jgi:hypothetical protein
LTASLKVICLGWGVQSWTLAAMAAMKELPPVDYAVHADTGHEMSGTYAHAKKWAPWLEEHGVKVVTVHSRRTEVIREDWSNNVQIPAFTLRPETGSHGQINRQCTQDWKITPIRQFIRTLIPKPRPGAVESWQGISLDEWQRMRTSDVAYIVNVYPLVDLRVTRAACVAWLHAHGLDIPPKSACTFCPYKSKNSWKELKRAGGADWAEAVAVDEAIRWKRPNFALFIHPARKPVAEAVAIPEDVGAKQMELEIPCDGGVCFV